MILWIKFGILICIFLAHVLLIAFGGALKKKDQDQQLNNEENKISQKNEESKENYQVGDGFSDINFSDSSSCSRSNSESNNEILDPMKNESFSKEWLQEAENNLHV